LNTKKRNKNDTPNIFSDPLEDNDTSVLFKSLTNLESQIYKINNKDVKKPPKPQKVKKPIFYDPYWEKETSVKERKLT